MINLNRRVGFLIRIGICIGLVYIVLTTLKKSRLDIMWKIMESNGSKYGMIHENKGESSISCEILKAIYEKNGIILSYGTARLSFEKAINDYSEKMSYSINKFYVNQDTQLNSETNNESPESKSPESETPDAIEPTSSTEPTSTTEQTTTLENNNSDENNTDGEGDNKVGEINEIYVSLPIKSIGTAYSYEQLASNGFVINKFFTVPSSTKLFNSDVDIYKVMSHDMTIKQDNKKPQILIYHTHSMEGFTDSKPKDINTSIVKVGDYLTTILSEQFGYNVIHCRDSFDYVDGVVNRTGAYNRAYDTISQILKDNPTIEVVLDIHRDGVDDDIHFVTDINNKDTAKIMFFNGLSRNSKGEDISYYHNKYREENLAMSIQMKLLAESFYPDYTRKNYVNSFHYNMNLRAKSMLIEVGAQTNSLQEALNAAEPLAVLLYKLLQ